MFQGLDIVHNHVTHCGMHQEPT